MKHEVGGYISKLVDLAATAMLSEIAFSQNKVMKKIPGISLVFRFHRNRINEYLRKVESEVSEEPLSKLPDIKDYLEEQKKEK